MYQSSITSFFAPTNAKPANTNEGTSKAKEKSAKRSRNKSDEGESSTKSPKNKKAKSEDQEKQETIAPSNSGKVKKENQENQDTDEQSKVKVTNQEATEQSNKMKTDSVKAEKENKIRTSPKPVSEIKLNFGASSKSQESKSDEYNPAVNKYNPIKNATWSRGDKVPYIALTRTLDEIEKISARLKIIELLSNYFRSVIVLSPDDLLPSVYLCLNKLAPAYEGLELGVADTSLMKAIAQSTGRSMNQIKSDCQSLGDIGLVAEQSKANQRMIFQPARLSVRSVFEKLKEIAKLTGHASQMKKVEKIQTMFVACKHSEARFLIRSLAGKLRIGLAEQSVLQALALACAMTPPVQAYPPDILDASKKISTDTFKEKYDKLALILKTTYCECPNYDMIIPRLLSDGIEELPKYCKLTPSIPLKPMLAHPTKGIQEILQRFDGMKFTCEWKYDGERAQIHMEGDKVHIFSRNQENNTTKYPDIIARFDKCVEDSVKSCILDCEAVAWDKENKVIQPFQVLSTRKRKDADESSIKVQVCVFMFDLLYLNGEPLVRKTFAERRELLKAHFKEVEGQWQFVTHMDASTTEQVQEFLEESIKGNCEGLMVKTLDHDSTYEIAKRSHKWLKVKKDYLDSVGDTLDLVVLGGYLGKGKRTGTYGGFLLGCYDQDSEEYQSICKIGTGFTDEDLQQHSTFFKEHLIDKPRPYYRFDSNLEPDHWFDTVQIWEVKCADLSLSPIHRAAIGIVDSEKGISLRFPRFIRIRDDKTVEEATSSQQVASLYSSQEQVKNQTVNSNAHVEEFY